MANSLSSAGLTGVNRLTHLAKVSHRMLLAGAMTASLGVAGCATGAQTGALVGAGVGASVAGRGDRAEGALVGAAIGAILGAIIDNEADRERYREGDYEYENEVSAWEIGDIRDETREQRERNDDLRREAYDLQQLARDADDPALSPRERREAREAVLEQQDRARYALRAVEYRLNDVDEALAYERMTPRRRSALRDYQRSLENARGYLEDILSIRV